MALFSHYVQLSVGPGLSNGLSILREDDGGTTCKRTSTEQLSKMRACLFARDSSDKVVMHFVPRWLRTTGTKTHNMHKAGTVYEVEQAKKGTNAF